MRASPSSSILLAATLAAMSACERPAETPPAAEEGAEEAPGEEPPAEEPPAEEALPEEPRSTGPTRSRNVYVPAYSHIGSPAGRQTLLAVTLSVRNVDPSSTVTLREVDYFDTSGHRVRRYLRAPQRLRPLETAEFFVETLDEAGGSGANFLVRWEGPPDAHALLTETVMIGHAGAGYLSFTSRGVELERRPVLELSDEDPPAAAP